MGQNLLRVCVHFVWATRDRLPLVTEDIERQVYRYISAVCQNDRCEVLAVGGMPDHVHLLVFLSGTVSLSDLMRHVKGGSSHLVSKELKPGDWFQWQASYSAFSVEPDERDVVIAYIANQKQHHADGTLWPSLEQTSDTSP